MGFGRHLRAGREVGTSSPHPTLGLNTRAFTLTALSTHSRLMSTFLWRSIFERSNVLPCRKSGWTGYRPTGFQLPQLSTSANRAWSLRLLSSLTCIRSEFTENLSRIKLGQADKRAMQEGEVGLENGAKRN